MALDVFQAPHSRRETNDSFNDETFGSLDCTSEDRVEEERKRRGNCFFLEDIVVETVFVLIFYGSTKSGLPLYFGPLISSNEIKLNG